MHTKLLIKIRRKSQPGWLIWFITIMPFLFGTLNDFIGLPYGIRYLLDLAWASLMVYLVRYYYAGNGRNTKVIILGISIFFVYAALIYLVEYQSILYFVWGSRNNLRFYVVFLAVAAFISIKDIERYLAIFDKLFWVNIVVSLVQFFVWGYNQDHLGGIFGIEKGCNAYNNIFFCLVLTKSIVFYLQKKEKTWVCVLKCAAALLVAALAELKFFFVEFVIIAVLAVLFTDFTWRKLLVVVGGAVLVSLGSFLLAMVFPSFAGFLSIDVLWDMATSDKGYTSSGDLNRLNAIPQINKLWLKNWSQRLFGLGLGNCETSSMTFLNTPFYQEHGWRHYTWLSYAFMYLECGWIGLIFYFGFFGWVFLKARKIALYMTGMEKSYCLLTAIISICCMITAIYNSSLRTEAGYMAYFILAIPFVLERNYSRENMQYKKESV